MNLSESTTDDGWCFAYETRGGHRVELEWVVARSRWVKRTKHHDPTVTDVPWSRAQDVPELPRVESEDEARSVAASYAERKP